MIPIPSYSFRGNVKAGLFNNSTYYWVLMPTQKAKAMMQMRDGQKKQGWGLVRVSATIGTSSWRTSVFPSGDTYLLLLNAKIRKAEKIKEGSKINVTLTLLS